MSTSYPLSIDKLKIVNNSDDESMSEPIEEPRTVRALKRFNAYASSLPYSIEANSQMQELLDYYLMKVVQCVKAKNYEPGLLQWDSMIEHWMLFKYPIPMEKRIKLARVYYELCVTPSMPSYLLATWASGLSALIRSKKKMSIKDMRLPWKPVYDILKAELFLTRRQFEINQVPYFVGLVAEASRRFFHPAAIGDMLEAFLPSFNGTSLNSMLEAEYYIVTFLPLSHPQSYLPLLFRLWEGINSYMWDERMLDFIAQLAELHLDPDVSDPSHIKEIPDDAVSEGEARPRWNETDMATGDNWDGITKDVGIFTDRQWSMIMSKCLSSMQIPLADTGSLTTGATVDAQAAFEFGRLPKATWRIYSLAKIIVWSMTSDGPVLPPSGAATPFGWPEDASELLQSSSSSKSYLAGCKALDSLARMILSTESFFHPSNSGTWTADLSAFIKCLASEFNKRWHMERKPDCKIPRHCRLTPHIKRELVHILRTPALLAAFSRDSTTVTNIQSCFKSMSTMEPDLVLYPVLERAVPSLETLVETHRTTAVIKALRAIALTMVNRKTYYPGAKHLLPILELLLPGIDLNDPTKTMCTTAFLNEISQCIKFGDLMHDVPNENGESQSSPTNGDSMPIGDPPLLIIEDLPHGVEPGDVPRLTKSEEDALLKESTSAFPDWIASFIRRVISLFENLPEDTGGEVRSSTESELVDAVTGACSQICIHLSEPLFELALNLVYDYASTTVRSNCVHAVHQLVKCLSTANSLKTLEKFLPFCITTIRTELSNGASSVRSTSVSSTPLPADATFHWALAILRGTMYNDGNAIVKHKKEILLLLRLLRDKTYSKWGFSKSGKLLSTILLTLTDTVPSETRFVNPDTWSDDDFRLSHDRYWGKLYEFGEAKIAWHVPSEEETAFALEIFQQLVQPSLDYLNRLLEDSHEDEAVWRNDFCRHLSFVRNAFAGTPTFAREARPADVLERSFVTTDILNEIPEMIATVEPLSAGFPLTEGDPRWTVFMNLKQCFGEFLLKAGKLLRCKGPENTVDSAQMLLRSIKTFMLDYGDSKESYGTLKEHYNSGAILAQQFVGQTAWPRAIFVRKARLYHAARLSWNSIERLRTELHDKLIDEVAEWSMWHYATVRVTSQTLMELICQAYDGVRRRVFPILYKALVPGAPDYRVKGALWQLNAPAFAKYAMTEPTLLIQFFKTIFSCQVYEKPSIQYCVGFITENCIKHFFEPCFLVYSLDSKDLEKAASDLEKTLPAQLVDEQLVVKVRKNREQRIQLFQSCFDDLTRHLTAVAQNPDTHWKYSLMVIRLLRTLIRLDRPIYGPQFKYFLEKAYDTNANMRYYALRSIMKALRYIKLRTSAGSGLDDLARGLNRNPLKRTVDIKEPSEAYTTTLLQAFKSDFELKIAAHVPLLKDRMRNGWLVWSSTDERYLAPPDDESVFQPWDSVSGEILEILQTVCCEMSFWQSISTYFAEENNQELVTMDHISAVKSIFQILEDRPLSSLISVIERLLAQEDLNKQRGVAELLAGVIGGSKHWPEKAQKRLWSWFVPMIPKVLGTNVRPDTLNTWTSFLEYLSWHKDPRRIKPLVDYVLNQFQSMDCNSESSFDAMKFVSFHRGIADEFGWKFTAWTDESLERYWKEIHSEHDEVRSSIADALQLSAKIMWRPKPSIPLTSCLLEEARIKPSDYDLLGIRGDYHRQRVQELVEIFPNWRKERVPGPRAFDSTYDRVAVLVCKWIFQVLHDLHAISAFDYILPLMPELFRFGEVNDNDELVERSKLVLVKMCGVIPPRNLIVPLLQQLFDAIQNSPSYKTRLNALPLLQIWYFRQGGSILAEEHVVLRILEVVSNSLDDEKIEVREMAGRTLAGILRSSPREPILMLKRRFAIQSKRILPPRNSTSYPEALRKLHGAILGICALVDAFPYTVESWTPQLLTEVLAEHVHDPLPIGATVRKCAADFRKSHVDTWHEDVNRFDEEQLSTISTMLSGNSYYA